MESDLSRLRLSTDELGALTGIDFEESLAGGLCQNTTVRDVISGQVWRDRGRLFSLLTAEAIAFLMTAIVSLPLALVLVRDRQISPAASATTDLILWLAVGISVLLTIAINFWVWWQVKPLSVLVRLLDDVDKYNRVIRAIEIRDRLASSGNLPSQGVSRGEVIKTLELTRESLICGLSSERILREHQGRGYELFSDLENNLSALMAVDGSNPANEYGQLLNDALEIGMSVHQEVRKLKRNP